jgi:hypothetical protein
MLLHSLVVDLAELNANMLCEGIMEIVFGFPRFAGAATGRQCDAPKLPSRL